MTSRGIDTDALAPNAPTWRKANFSVEAECVELSSLDGLVAIRNSNDPDSKVLIVGRADLASWIAAIKAGEFDYLVT